MFDIRSLLAAFRRPRDLRTAFARGVAAFDAGRHEVALAEFEVALAEVAQPEPRAAIHNKRGVVFVALGQREAALAAFCDALDAHERCAPALANVGNLLLEDGHVLDAVDYYQAAIRADEGYAVAHRNLGVAYKRLGRPAEAVRALRLAARLEGRRPLARG